MPVKIAVSSKDSSTWPAKMRIEVDEYFDQRWHSRLSRLSLTVKMNADHGNSHKLSNRRKHMRYQKFEAALRSVPLKQRTSHTDRQYRKLPAKGATNAARELLQVMQEYGWRVTWTTGTAERVPGLWSLRCPVIQAFSPFSCRLSGRTCTHTICYH